MKNKRNNWRARLLLETMGIIGDLAGVYVRQLEDGETIAYYVGETKDLSERYTNERLREVIYFEPINTKEQRIAREEQLVHEFISVGLPLVHGSKYCQKSSYLVVHQSSI